jgi:hypothetical protein
MAWMKVGDIARRLAGRIPRTDDNRPLAGGSGLAQKSRSSSQSPEFASARDDRADRGRRPHSRGAAPGRPPTGPGGGASTMPADGRGAVRRLAG